MKKILLVLCLMFACFLVEDINVSAKSVVASDYISDVSGQKIGVIEIYDTSEIKISYKYGLRLAELRYCIQGEECDMNVYNYKLIVEASESQPYKNTKNELTYYRYKPILEDGKKYRFEVTAFFGSTSGYSGTEDVNIAFMLQSLELDTNDVYIEGSKSADFGDENINDLMDDLQTIVNKVVLPVIYAILGLLLVVKGTLLGVDIVKNADKPEIRSEKVHGLKWLIIGVAIAMFANTVVGVLTGFFSSL